MASRLLIYTNAFAPNIGGVETYVMLLARGLAGTDLKVILITPTPLGGMNDADLPFRVVRRPDFVTLAKLVWHSDVLHLAGPCFLPMMLGLILQKPVVVEHHGYHAVCPNGLLFFEPTKSLCPGHFMAHSYHKCLQCNARRVGAVKSIA